MKVLIIWDSVYGNTEQVGKAMAEALSSLVEVSALHVGEVSGEEVGGADLVIVGSPTRGFRPTEAIQALIKDLPGDAFKSTKVSAFDTRIAEGDVGRGLRLMIKVGGYAAGRIAKSMKKKGADVIATEGFFVQDREGPLKQGECERAAAWARDVVSGVPVEV